jgi:hypothetical protein
MHLISVEFDRTDAPGGLGMRPRAASRNCPELESDFAITLRIESSVPDSEEALRMQAAEHIT